MKGYRAEVESKVFRCLNCAKLLIYNLGLEKGVLVVNCPRCKATLTISDYAEEEVKEPAKS